MEPTHDMPPAGSNIPCPATGELVIQNGRLSGTRRPLHPSLTLIGRSDDCDVRLNVDGVSPLHCALVQGPAGLVVRDLHSEGGTLVNGEPAVTTLVHDGDLLTVGPFRFRVRLPEKAAGTEADKPSVGSAALHDLEIVLREKEALRIQAAAVAAQQAALTEEEAKLQQQQTTLQRQEEQLAAHLEEKRKRLLDLQQQVQTAREELRKERAAYEARSNEMLRDLTRVRGELALSQKQTNTERRRLVELRRRLKKRWRRHWSVQESTLQRREGELAKQQYTLEKDSERLQKERAVLVEARLRFNGEVELGKRQLQAAWDDLRQGQHRWKDQRNLEQAELRRQAEDLCLREETLRDAEEELAEQRQHWEMLRLDLEREVEGLEGRVRNYRRKLLDQRSEVRSQKSEVSTDQTVSSLAIVLSSRPPVHQSPPAAGLTVLHKLVAELADQRLHLAEQCERLLRAQQRWQENRDAIVAELETVGMRLQEREQTLTARECQLQTAEYEGRQRREQQALARQHLDGWHARLAAREAAWESEREGLLARLHAREELVKRYLSIMADLRQRWAQRRRQEVEHWRAESKHCQEIRQHYALLWEEYTRRNAAVEQEQRILAERALAMEQFRLECIGQSANSPAAEKRLERLRRRWAALSAAAQRALAKERHALQAEASRLEERSRQLEQYAAELAARATDLSSRQTEWQHEQTSAEGAQTRMRQELQSLRVQHDLHERQIHTLRDELERMAQTLIEESEPLTLPAVQAA